MRDDSTNTDDTARLRAARRMRSLLPEFLALTLLTTPEVAELLAITPGRIHQLLHRMERKPMKRGMVRLWTRSDIANLQEIRKSNGRPRGPRKPRKEKP